MSPWDYVAIFVVWYLISARPAIGAEFTLNAMTRLLWPLFLVSLVSHGFRHAAFKRELARKAMVLSALALLAYGGYNVATLISGKTAIRFLLTFPIASLGSLALIAGGALFYSRFFENNPPSGRKPRGCRQRYRRRQVL